MPVQFEQLIKFPEELPISQSIIEITEAIRQHPVIVIAGETGSGKTTQIPKICLKMGRGTAGLIGHTQPRRVAARSIATRIAAEINSVVGEIVGYQVRFTDRVSEKTQIKLMTDGILLAEIQHDRHLSRYDTLIIDEAHERSLNIDFILGYLKQLLPRRPDLKVIITSATLDPKRFTHYFSNAPLIEVQGRGFPVEIRYRPLVQDDDIEDQDQTQAILEAVDEVSTGDYGDILIFLTGEREIRETAEALRKHHPLHTEILPLYARQNIAEQNRIFEPHTGRRIILATNVAETSLTVPGIRYVIDAGFARIKRYSYRTKIQRLPIELISQASAKQRSGRCGRVSAGICIRLYAESDFLSRAEFTEPELLRSNLAAVILQMTALKLGDIENFPFIEPPDSRLIRDGYKLLQELGAMNDGRQLTEIGKQLAKLPIDPRLGRMILAAQQPSCLAEILIMVSALSVQDPRDRPMGHEAAADAEHRSFVDERSDFLTYLNLWNVFHQQNKHLSNRKLHRYCRDHFLSYLRLQEWHEVHNQLVTIVKDLNLGSEKNDLSNFEHPISADRYSIIHHAILTGLLSHIGLKAEDQSYLGARQTKFNIFPGSALFKKKPKWVMAAEMVETARIYGRVVAGIEPEWIEDLAQHLLKKSYAEPHWEKKRSQVVAFEKSTLYGLIINPKRKVNYGVIDPALSREIFIRGALVQAEYETSAGFFKHNQNLIQELQAVEDKIRRRDVLVDEEFLYEFYAKKIPEGIYNGPLFEKWREQIERTQPKLLFLTREELNQDDRQKTQIQFPDEIIVNDIKLPLSYHFEPGHPEDGVTVTIPLALVNQLSASAFEWLVPGLLRDKMIALIKSLPKSLRRCFSPAADFSEACLQRLSEDIHLKANDSEHALLATLANYLHKISGVKIPNESWNLEGLAPHLLMNFKIVDSENTPLATGRNLTHIQQQLAGNIAEKFQALTATDYERTSITQWDFSVLPQMLELEREGLFIKGYPALVDQGDCVALQVIANEQQAKDLTRCGLRRLYLLAKPYAIQQLRKNIMELNPSQRRGDRRSTGPIVLTLPELTEDVINAVMDIAFSIKEIEVRDKEMFDRQVEVGFKQLQATYQVVIKWVVQILALYHQVTREINQSTFDAAIKKELNEHLENLIYKDFVTETPYEWLQRIPYYLKAIQTRMRKLTTALAKDREYARELTFLWNAYQQRLEQHHKKGIRDPALLEYRWMLEEYRLSLFAQELKTKLPISRKRLDAQWEKIKNLPC